MPFFERPPREHDDEDDDFDNFVEPRRNHMGGVVAVELLLARSDTAVVAIRSIVAYPDGFEFTLTCWVRRHPRPRRPRRFRQPVLMHPMEVEDGEDLPPEFLRFGIEFPDGARVTNLDAPHWRMSPDATEPAHGLETRGGSGNDAEYEQEFTAWPLPTPGALAFVCEWPAYDIPETRVEIHAGLLIDAATRATPIWPND